MTTGTYHPRQQIDVEALAPITRNGDTPGLSIVIPAYNEEGRLPSTLLALERFIARNQLSCEVIVVDNASADGTSSIVNDAARRLPWLRLLRINQRGKGVAVRSGVLAARGAVVVFADADLSWSLEDLLRFPALVADGAAVVIGSREEPGASRVGSPMYRVLMSRVFNFIVRVVAIGGIGDTQCGFKVFRADAAQAIFSNQRVNGFGFDVEVLYLARRLGYTIAETPLKWEHRDGSQVSPARDVLKMLMDVLTVRVNALRGRYPRSAATAEYPMPLAYTLPNAGA